MHSAASTDEPPGGLERAPYEVLARVPVHPTSRTPLDATFAACPRPLDATAAGNAARHFGAGAVPQATNSPGAPSRARPARVRGPAGHELARSPVAEPAQLGFAVPQATNSPGAPSASPPSSGSRSLRPRTASGVGRGRSAGSVAGGQRGRSRAAGDGPRAAGDGPWAAGDGPRAAGDAAGNGRCFWPRGRPRRCSGAVS